MNQNGVSHRGLEGPCRPEARLRHYAVCLLQVLIACAAFSGCGGSEKTIQLRGSIGWGDQPLKLREDESLEIHFLYVGPDGVEASAVAMCEPDGTFAVAESLPAGAEMRIALVCSINRPVDDETTSYEEFDRNSTPLVYQATEEGEQSIHINLKRQTVEKK